MRLARLQTPNALAWPRFGPLTDLHDEIDRLFGLSLGELSSASPWMSGWVPALDVHEDKDQFIVKAEMPGMKKDEIEVSLPRRIVGLEHHDLHRISDQAANAISESLGYLALPSPTISWSSSCYTVTAFQSDRLSSQMLTPDLCSGNDLAWETGTSHDAR